MTRCTSDAASPLPRFGEPAQRQNAGRSVVTATRPPLTSHVSLSPGSKSSASRTSFGTVVCPLVVIVDVGMSASLREYILRKECGEARFSVLRSNFARSFFVGDRHDS